MSTSSREAAHAARRADKARKAIAAAATPAERAQRSWDWFRAASPGDRMLDAVARHLTRLAGRLDDRTAAHGSAPDSGGASDSVSDRGPVKEAPYVRSRAITREGLSDRPTKQGIPGNTGTALLSDRH